jgi:hypothetical protein
VLKINTLATKLQLLSTSFRQNFQAVKGQAKLLKNIEDLIDLERGYCRPNLVKQMEAIKLRMLFTEESDKVIELLLGHSDESSPLNLIPQEIIYSLMQISIQIKEKVVKEAMEYKY